MAEPYTNLQKTGTYSTFGEQKAAETATAETKKLMDSLNASIKAGNFSKGYLLFGQEGYLVRFYKNNLKKALSGDDTMNFTYFTGAFDIQEFISIADTMPFFADRRVILVENSSYFSAGRGGGVQPETTILEEYLPTMPDSTVVIFAEQNVDKRFKVYKAFSEIGQICQFNYMDKPWIINWMCAKARASRCLLSTNVAGELIDRVGVDLNILSNEIDKLTAFKGPDTEIKSEDIDCLATGRLEDSIFEMITNVLKGNMSLAMKQYADIVGLREAPIKLLVIIGKQCSQAIAVKEAKEKGLSDSDITKLTGATSYRIKNIMNDLRNCSIKKLAYGVSLAAEMDYAIKSGNMEDRLALEVLLSKLGQQ